MYTCTVQVTVNFEQYCNDNELMNLNLYSVKTIEEYSKALYINE